MKKKITAIILLAAAILILPSCSKGSGSVNFGEYNPAVESTVEDKDYDITAVLNVDKSWQNCYALSYTYYDTKTGESKIDEGRCGNYYQSLDTASRIITFLTQEDGYMIEYMLDENTMTGTATAVTDSDIDNLKSGFTVISTCDPYFSVYKNVTKIGKENVANRSATKYKQVQNDENGKPSKIAYVWIDDQYCFASRCELFDANTYQIMMKWEMQTFTQNVTEDGVKINIDNYSITDKG